MHDADLALGFPIDAANDIHHFGDIDRGVGDDHRISRRVGDQVALRRQQRTQYRDQFVGGNILQRDHPNHDLAIFPVSRPDADRPGRGLGLLDRQYRDDAIAAPYRGIAVDFQYRQKQIVEAVLIQWSGGDHIDLALDIGVYEKCLAGGIGDKFDQLGDIGIAKIDGEAGRRQRCGEDQ